MSDSLTVWVVNVGRTRWRLHFGRWRIGFRRNEGYGDFALPFLLVNWITRSKEATYDH